MKRPKKRVFLLAAVVSFYGAFVVSDHGVLFWLTNTTPPPPDWPVDGHGVIPTFRCHYFTGTGTFGFETSMAFGAETCDPIKRQNRTLWGFDRSRFA